MALAISAVFASCDGKDDASSEAISASSNNPETFSEPVESSLPLTGSSARTSEIEFRAVPTGVNIARTATYTVKKNGVDEAPESLYLLWPDTKWADADKTRLNDGRVALGSEMDANGCTENVNVVYIGTSAAFNHVFELDDFYKGIRTVVFRNVRDYCDNSFECGWNRIFVYVSDDGLDWSAPVDGCEAPSARVPVPGAVEIQSKKDSSQKSVKNFDITYTFTEAVQAKFIKIVICGDSGTYVLQLDKIEIRG